MTPEKLREAAERVKHILPATAKYECADVAEVRADRDALDIAADACLTIAAAKERVKELEAEVKDWQASFALYDNALRRGTSLYNNAHTEKLKSLPDTASMIQWLCDSLATAERERELLRKEVRRMEVAVRKVAPSFEELPHVLRSLLNNRSAEVRALVDSAGPSGATG
ncbi:MAG: hypothetical protein IT366_21335 [Candidatus Hydrogenedentes bacterium]|nr:hypothetical protein [Candidatus Hydrogenedentota bacterium]